MAVETGLRDIEIIHQTLLANQVSNFQWTVFLGFYIDVELT